jgi:hypothetical protein
MVFIDGMGNDSYMGHLPGKRELDKLFLQKIFTKLNLQKLISIKLSNLDFKSFRTTVDILIDFMELIITYWLD